MTSEIETLFALMPPILIFLSGFCTLHFFLAKYRAMDASYKIIFAIIFGTFLFTFPYIIVGILKGNLRFFTLSFSLYSVFITTVSLMKVRRSIWKGIKLTVKKNLDAFFSGPIIRKICFSIIFGYSIKVILTCLFGVVYSGDGFRYWIPLAKMFFITETIPLINPYDSLPVSEAPAFPALLSFGLFLHGFVDSEAYRGIPILFFILVPLTIYKLCVVLSSGMVHNQGQNTGVASIPTKYNERTESIVWLGTEQAETHKSIYGIHKRDIALVGIIFLVVTPIFDSILLFYTFYPDILALGTSLAAILCFYSAIVKNDKIMVMISGISLLLTLLIKYPFGEIAIVFLLLESILYFGNGKWFRKISIILVVMMIMGITFISLVTWNTYHNFFAVFSTLLLAAFVIALYYTRYCRLIPISSPSIVFLLIIFACISLASIWGVYTYINGFGLFGLPFFNSSYFTGYSQVLQITENVFPNLPNFTIITPWQLLFHPLTNGYFFIFYILVIYGSFKNKRLLEVLGYISYFYLVYVAILGNFISGRHLLFSVSFFPILLTGGLWNIGLSSSREVMRKQFFFGGFLFVISAFLLWPTMTLLLEKLGLSVLLVFPFNPIINDFSLVVTPLIYLKIIVVGTFFFSLFSSYRRYLTGKSKNFWLLDIGRFIAKNAQKISRKLPTMMSKQAKKN